MTIQYGLTNENHHLIIDRARSKKNGVYRFRGIAYRVENNSVTHVSDGDTILECCGGFNVQVGRVCYYNSQPLAEKAQKYMKDNL